MKIRSLAMISCLAFIACGPKDGPADEEDLARAVDAYRGAQKLLMQQISRSDVYFPTIRGGHAYEDNIGFQFKSDSVQLNRIDSSAFVDAFYRLPSGTLGVFSVDMKRDGAGGWSFFYDTSEVRISIVRD